MREGTRAFLEKRKPEFTGEETIGADISMRVIDGAATASGLRFAVVVSKYHDFVTDRLREGRALRR